MTTPAPENPYAKAVNDYLRSQGIDPNSPKGQEAQAQAAQSGGSGFTADGALKTALSAYMKKKLMNYMSSSGPVEGPWSNATASSQAQYGGNALSGGAPSAPSGAPQTAGGEALQSVAPQGVTAVGTNADGSTAMSDGTKVLPDGTVQSSTGQTIGNGALIVGGALQAYNGYGQYQDGEKLGGAANMAGGAYNMAAGGAALAGSTTLASYVPAAGTAVAAAQVGQQMMNEMGSSEDRAAKSQTEAQKAALLYMGPYGWAAYAVLAGADLATGGKASGQLTKWNGKIDKMNDKIDFGLGKNIRSKVFHQSTKGVQEMHTGQLAQKSEGDQGYLEYLGAMRAQVKDGPADKEKPFAGGKYKSFDEYQKAGLDAADLTGVYGNLQAYAPDWAQKQGIPDWSKLSFDQQKQITQANIDQGLYKSKKGEVYITDRDKAQQNFISVLGGPAAIHNYMAGQGAAPGAPAATPAPGAPAPRPLPAPVPQRSQTSSPGISKDGKRIKY